MYLGSRIPSWSVVSSISHFAMMSFSLYSALATDWPMLLSCDRTILSCARPTTYKRWCNRPRDRFSVGWPITIEKVHENMNIQIPGLLHGKFRGTKIQIVPEKLCNVHYSDLDYRGQVVSFLFRLFSFFLLHFHSFLKNSFWFCVPECVAIFSWFLSLPPSLAFL